MGHSSTVKPRGFAVLALMIAAPLIYYVSQAGFRTPPLSTPKIIAHRGGPRYAPENTLAAFRNAIAQGADAIEFDVQMSSDGALIVIHDETVDRTTDGSGSVRDKTLAELRALDTGSGESVPTFGEVVALAKASGVMILPEAKWPHLYPGLEATMLQALREADYTDHAIVQSFNAESLERFRALDAEVKLCVLYGLWGFNVGSPPGRAQYVCPMAEMVLLNPGMIRQAHAEGRQVFVWFGAIESPLVLNILRFFGVDGFIVDDPQTAQVAGR
jgi:glycerophosphoryl diester phosphodiesterase